MTGYWAWLAGNRITPARINAFQSAYKPADQSVTNSGTLVDDNDLLFTIGASEVWGYVFNFLYTNSDASPSVRDCNIGINFPSGATVDFGITSFTTTDGFRSDGVIGATTTTPTGIGGTLANARYAHIAGTCINSSTPGNVALRFCQNSAAASTSVTAKRGSNMWAWRIA